MRGIKTINESTLKECADYLAQNEGGAYVEEVKARYKALLEEMAKQEDTDFKACKTIADYEKFIAKYKSKSVEPYRAKHLDDAEKAKQRLISEAKRLEEERQRREREERIREQQRAEERKRKRKRTFLIVLASLVAVAVAVFFIGYRPVKFLTASDVVFGKEGGQQNLRINTFVSGGRVIDIYVPSSEDWLTADHNSTMINISAIPNPNPERSCVIKIRACSTFFGERIGLAKSKEIIVRQGSGYATNLKVSSKKLDVSQYGDTKRINVKTDGVGLGLSSNASWIHVTPKSQNHDGQYYHDDDYEVGIDENPNGERKGTIIVETGGKKQEIAVTQASGYASNLYVSSQSLSIGKYGENRQINIKTDGVNLKLSTDDGWIHLTKKNQNRGGQYYHDEDYEIAIGVNHTDKRNGTILVETGGQKREIAVSQVSGLASRFKTDCSSIEANKSGTGEGKCYRVKVDTDGTEWSASSNYDWLDIKKFSDNIEITVRRNSGDVRTGYVTLHSNNNHKKTVEIKQDGAPTSFYASYSSWTFDTGSDYEYISIYNNSNQSMYASADKSWLDASMSSGGKVKITCERNNNSPRDGTVTVRCDGKTCSIKVHQKGWSTCWQCLGSGKTACDNYRAVYTFDNWGNYGHGYVYFDGWGNRYVNACEVCGGSGRKNCSNCGGNGKVKSN